MSQADELLNTLAADYTSEDGSDEEPHIVIHRDRTITVPDELKHIAVQYDHNVETVTFDCPRYWDGHDFSTMSVYVNYERADGYRDQYHAKDLRVDESDETIIHFEWTISKNVTQRPGGLTFLVCIKSIASDGEEEPHWNSRLNSEMTIDPGMECSEQIVESYPDALEYVYNKVDSVGTPDWNAAEGEPGHVLNRTHWVEGEMVEILPETTLTSYSGNPRIFDTPWGITSGKTYIVNFNGVEYPCTAFTHRVYDSYDVTILGDFHNGIDELPATGEPFGIMETDAETAAALDMAGFLVTIRQNVSDSSIGEYDFTISIAEVSETIHKLPGKFLPEGVPYVEKTVLLEETDAVETTDPTFGKCWLINKAPMLTVGETYTVVYNGVAYDCMCYPGELPGMGVPEDAVGMGNFAAVGGEDTGEPFAMLIVPSQQLVTTLDLSGAASVRIGIKSKVIIQKLDPKCLPDGVPYVEKLDIVEILPECQPTYVADSNMFVITENDPALVIDQTYIVNWNGTEYTCIGQDMSALEPGAVALGNVNVLIGTGDSGEPFVILGSSLQDGNYDIVIKPLDGTTELTLSIKNESVTIQKIDPRCLPTPDDYYFASNLSDSGNFTEDVLNADRAIKNGAKAYATHNGQLYEVVMVKPDLMDQMHSMVLQNTGGTLYCFIPGFNLPWSITESIQTDRHTRKLPAGLMPEVRSVVLLSSTDGSSKKFKLTVDDSGTITATEV